MYTRDADVDLAPRHPSTTGPKYSPSAPTSCKLIPLVVETLGVFNLMPFCVALVIFFEANVRPVADTTNNVNPLPPFTETVTVRFAPAFAVAAAAGWVKPTEPTSNDATHATANFFQRLCT